MPLIRRLPKRGFNAPFTTTYQVVNVSSLNRFKENSVVGLQELKEAGLVTSTQAPVKILGDGELKKALTVKAHKISASAQKKMAAAGAKIEILK